MGEIAQWLPTIIFTVLLLIPAVRILARTGKSRWWALFVLLPFFGVVALMWILAYSRWPAQRNIADVFA